MRGTKQTAIDCAKARRQWFRYAPSVLLNPAELPYYEPKYKFIFENYLNYHFVWIPMHRRKVLVGKIAVHLEELLKELAQKYAIEILDYSIQPDHVHLFVSAPPRFSPASLVNLFKGFTGRKLREAFPDLIKHHSKKLWTRTYLDFVL